MIITKELCDKWFINKNINPLTLRKIKETGAIYKELSKKCSFNPLNPIKSKKKTKKEKEVKLTDSQICNKWLANKNINPITSRKIKETGAIYKELSKKCSLNPLNPINSYINNDNAANKIQKLFTPFIKRVSPNIIDRINFFTLIRKYILSIKKKHKNICMRLYKFDEKTKKPIYRLGNRIILDKQIGSKSAYGIVYLAHYKPNINNENKLDKLNKFAIKVINYSINNEIEYKVLTELSKQVILLNCPHFPITYGLLSCDNKKIRSNYDTSIILDINKSDVNNKKYYPDLINNNTSLYYQINELASGDFMTYRKTFINNDYLILNAIAQIYISIMFFHKYINAFHNDAHAGNFLYHKVKPGGYFHYNIYGKDYYIENIGYLWVIWDFGLIQPFANTKMINNNKFGKFKKRLNISVDYLRSIQRIIDFPHLFNPSLNSIINIFSKTLNKYIDTMDVLLLSDLNKQILIIMNNNISTFSDIKPDNIINKKPYII
jgi:hypothetical protein